MPLIAVTRLRLRSLRFLPGFAWHSWTSARQAQRAPGYLDGQLASEGMGAFWTLTAWRDRDAMRRYQTSDAHLRAMPRLLDWCDEASVTQWEQDGPELPDGATVRRRMIAEGRPSKVRHPSPEHAARRIAAGEPRNPLRLRRKGGLGKGDPA